MVLLGQQLRHGNVLFLYPLYSFVENVRLDVVELVIESRLNLVYLRTEERC